MVNTELSRKSRRHIKLFLETIFETKQKTKTIVPSIRLKFLTGKNFDHLSRAKK